MLLLNHCFTRRFPSRIKTICSKYSHSFLVFDLWLKNVWDSTWFVWLLFLNLHAACQTDMPHIVFQIVLFQSGLVLDGSQRVVTTHCVATHRTARGHQDFFLDMSKAFVAAGSQTPHWIQYWKMFICRTFFVKWIRHLSVCTNYFMFGFLLLPMRVARQIKCLLSSASWAD